MSVLDGEGHVARRVNTPLPLTPSTSFLPELLITSLCPTPCYFPLPGLLVTDWLKRGDGELVFLAPLLTCEGLEQWHASPRTLPSAIGALHRSHLSVARDLRVLLFFLRMFLALPPKQPMLRRLASSTSEALEQA